MTPDSTAEQTRLGLMALSAETMARLSGLNRDYAARFGYPFIVALRLHASLDSVLLSGEARLQHSAETEWPIALQQVCEVMRGRLVRVVREVEASAADFSSAAPSSSPTLT
jgi:2-oxo-4-hydroxy-4-carboxy-5-ureidoimidazoline decarboxylase